MKKIFLLCTFIFTAQTIVLSQDITSQDTRTLKNIQSKSEYNLIVNKSIKADFQRTSENPQTQSKSDVASKQQYTNSVFKMLVADDNALNLVGDWKIEIDPKEFIVNIKGSHLSNLSNEEIDGLIVDVFFTNDKIAKLNEGEFRGVRISSTNIGKIGANQNFNNINMKANMLTVPVSGDYHILLTVSSIDEDGNQVVRSSRYFENPITF